MKSDRIVRVDTKIDAKVFRDFSDFNAFVIGKRRLTMIAASIVLIILAVINWRTGGIVLTYLCAALAVLAPLMFMLRYTISVKGQIQRFRLEQPRQFYTVKISAGGVDVQNETEHVKFQWKQAYRVYERDDYFYIFITKARGYILPKADIVSGTEDLLREIIKENMPEIRYFDKRRQKNG